MKSNKSINKLLYEKRKELKLTRKEASILIGINRLHLMLIEKGYLVPRWKVQLLFTIAYNLKDDFFTTNSTYITPLDKDEEDENKTLKFRKRFSKKRFKVIAWISLAISCGAIAFGVYGINRRFITPRIAWSETYTKFYEKMKSIGTKSQSLLALDNVYTVTQKGKEYPVSSDLSFQIDTSISMYEKETSAADTNIDSTIIKKTIMPGKEGLQEEERFGFYLFTYNKKKLIFVSYSSGPYDIEVQYATSIINNGEVTLREFDYTKGGKRYHASTSSDAYKKLYNSLLIAKDYAFNDVNDVLINNGLYYTDVENLLSDVQRISRDYVLFERLGFSFIICFSFTACVSIVLGAISYHSTYKLKPNKKEKEEFPIPIISRDIPIRGIVNDIKYPSFVPEFALRGIGLIILALSSITLFASVYLIFGGDFIGFSDAQAFKKITSNFLVSAILLLFFVKLDVYAKKSRKDLLVNIIALFIGGLMFYILEVLVYRAILIEGNAFSALLEILTQVIPGNVIWNIMLYSLIFYFLFTLPKKYEGKPAKILRWRLFSLIPTFILLFALFYKIFLESMIPSAYYISFLFHTSGVINTIFAIVYIYGLYFLKFRNTLTYGESNAEKYSYSKRFGLEKNILASIIILILFAIDMFFKYNAPDNPLKLGRNWTIILLIPFILLYRPHIGKRNKTWDTVYTALYAITFAGGYVATTLFVLSKLNLVDLAFILF